MVIYASKLTAKQGGLFMSDEIATQVSKHCLPMSCSLFESAKPVYACQLDGKGGSVALTDTTEATTTHPCWVHFDYRDQNAIDWINSTPLLPTMAKSALLASKQQAKEMRLDSGLLVVLKGVNITPGDLPDPIVTLRFYITDNLIVSTRHKQIDAMNELQDNFDKSIGPVDVADWLVQTSDILADHANMAVDSCHSQLIKLEDRVLSQKMIAYKDIGRVRKQLIILRRLLSPQRDIFVKIATERLPWIDDNDRQHMHDIATRLSHYVDDIDACLMRISSIMEQISAMLTESMNKRIYFMSLLATIFMPCTFLASLFGINLSGIPFSQEPWAFGLFTLSLIIICTVLMVWFKIKKWL